jgi:hypothetical protein
MKKIMQAKICCALMLLCGLSFTACKSRTTTDPQAPPAASPMAPDTAVTTNSTTAVQIASTDSLQSGLKDATKDYPLVHAAVDSGVITLTGEIKRSQLPKLMTSLHSLHPKKINNNLTIK